MKNGSFRLSAEFKTERLECSPMQRSSLFLSICTEEYKREILGTITVK